jgi:hypothetical protein
MVTYTKNYTVGKTDGKVKFVSVSVRQSERVRENEQS